MLNSCSELLSIARQAPDRAGRARRETVPTGRPMREYDFGTLIWGVPIMG